MQEFDAIHFIAVQAATNISAFVDSLRDDVKIEYRLGREVQNSLTFKVDHTDRIDSRRQDSLALAVFNSTEAIVNVDSFTCWSRLSRYLRKKVLKVIKTIPTILRSVALPPPPW